MKIKIADILTDHAWEHASEKNQMLRHVENFTPGTKARPISYFESETALLQAAHAVFSENLEAINAFRKDLSQTQIEFTSVLDPKRHEETISSMHCTKADPETARIQSQTTNAVRMVLRKNDRNPTGLEIHTIYPTTKVPYDHPCRRCVRIKKEKDNIIPYLDCRERLRQANPRDLWKPFFDYQQKTPDSPLRFTNQNSRETQQIKSPVLEIRQHRVYLDLKATGIATNVAENCLSPSPLPEPYEIVEFFDRKHPGLIEAMERIGKRAHIPIEPLHERFPAPEVSPQVSELDIPCDSVTAQDKELSFC